MNTPWYKQFWPWFLILLPLSAVVGSFTTLFIFSNNSVEIVVDDYYKKGKAINMDLQKIQQAKSLNLSFALSVESDILYLDKQTGTLADQAALSLNFYHPTLSERDFNLLLSADAFGRYSAQLTDIPQGKWQLTLQPFDQAWKIKAQAYFPTPVPLILK